jgi:sarcosine oxidase
VDNAIGYYEPGAGFLRPEACVRSQLALAERMGARVHRDERVLRFAASGSSVTVSTTRDEYTASRVIVCAGPWLAELLEPALSKHFRVTRQAIFWFAIDGPVEPFEPGRFPTFIWELPRRSQPIYGLPAIDGAHGGLKVATETLEATTTPEAVAREVAEAEWGPVFDDLVAPHVKGLRRECVRATTCLYTMTPDFHFVIDRHPSMPAVLVVSPCAGHGFKHSAAIGEAIARSITGEPAAIDLSSFGFGRFG